MAKTNKPFLLLVFLIASALMISVMSFSILAQDETEDSVTDTEETTSATTSEIPGETAQKNLAFNWIYNEIKEGWPQSIEDNAFALLALSSDSELREQGKNELLKKKIGVTGSNVKDSAVALLALNNIGEDVDFLKDWLISQKQPFKASNLEWRIQLDYSGATSCDITYGGKTDVVEIDRLKPLKFTSSGIPNCLSVTEDNWLKISSTADNGKCLEKTYSIKCDDSIKASLIYKKGSIIFVPSKTESSDYIDLKIESICLADRGICDYGSNLWAAYALSKAGSEEINTLLPYLISQEEVEEDYLPYSFLYMLTENDDYADGLMSQQEPKGYWYTAKYGKWHSTALAYMAVKDYYSVQENMTKIKKYILDAQSSQGSWDNNLKDTAFLFYALWPSYYVSVSEENMCTEKGFKCRTICDSEDEVKVDEYSFYCGEEVCCMEKAYSPDCTTTEDCIDTECDRITLPTECICEYNREKSCNDKCDNDADGLTDDEDTDCQIPECEANGYLCCAECEWGHKNQYDYSCELGKCCEECMKENEICNNKEDDDDDAFIDCDDPDCDLSEQCQKSSILWYIIPGLIIILAAVYIYFNKTKGFNIIDFFRERFSKSKKPKFPSQPGAQMQTRTGLMNRPMMKPGIRTFPHQVQRQSEKSETETELERTIKKLKEMREK